MYFAILVCFPTQTTALSWAGHGLHDQLNMEESSYTQARMGANVAIVAAAPVAVNMPRVQFQAHANDMPILMQST